MGLVNSLEEALRKFPFKQGGPGIMEALWTDPFVPSLVELS